MELWEVYGSKGDYRKAPKSEALQVQLALQKKHELENEQAAEDRKRQAELDAKMAEINAKSRG